MGFLHQTWTLTEKNLLIVLWRHTFSTILRALVLPVVFMFFISYAKNFFVPPSTFGIASPTPILAFTDALQLSLSSRVTVAFLSDDTADEAINSVIEDLSSQVTAGGKTPRMLSGENELLSICRSTIRGVSTCYGAVTFHSSPSTAGVWNYTLQADGILAAKIWVDRTDNDAQIYTLPFQRAIDDAILRAENGSTIPQVDQFPFTSETQDERAQRITKIFQDSILSFLGVAFFIGIVGVTYQLVGHMALERELEISQLIEASMPNKNRMEPLAARLISYHLAFDIVYFPGWLIMGIIVRYLVYPEANIGVVIVLHLLVGLALTSFSIMIGSFFKKAQLSGITSTIASLVLAIIAQLGVGSDSSAGAVIILGLIFPPMTYVFALMGMSKFQQQTLPVNLARNPPNSTWQFPQIVFWVLFIIQILVFPLLGAFFERFLYGTASKSRIVRQGVDQMADSSAAILLKNFSKHYDTARFTRNFLRFGRKRPEDTVVAVEDVTLSFPKGQIMVLLGANGSGKSTTLSCVAGLNKTTTGSIELDGTGGLGLCPQKNVLWDEVTVYEHVKIFNRLKNIGGEKASRNDIHELVSSCDLAQKIGSRAGTLSGGQKRKLQLAMMFTGGSRVCLVDEVSSGVDPLARRKIWDILLGERGKRTIVLTTHFLDEADVLSDQIAILSKGALKASGSAVELKHTLSGYRVSVPHSANYVPKRGEEFVSHHSDYEHSVYQLKDSSSVSRFIDVLERQDVPYSVDSPTIEEIFLQICDEVKDELEQASRTKATSPSSQSVQSSQTLSDSGSKKLHLDLISGKGTTLGRQTWVLFRKRFVVLQRNWLPYAAAILIPVITAGMVTLFLQGGFEPLGCSPTDQISAGDITNLTDFFDLDVVYGPPGVVPQYILDAYPNLNETSLHSVDTSEAFFDYVNNHYHNVTPGGFFTPTSGNTVLGFLGQYDVAWSVIMQNIVNNVLGRIPISTQYQPFALPFAPRAGDTLQLVLYFGLAMSIYPAFFALYPTAERLRKIRALHFSNGVRSAPLWIAYTMFDFLSVLLVSMLAVIIFSAAWSGWYNIGYVFVVFFLYGLTSTAFSYVISLFVTSQLAAFAFAAGIQAVFFLLYFIAYMAIITYAPVDQIDHYVSVAHYTISLITPAGSMLRTLLLTLNEFSLLCRGNSTASYAGAIDVFGAPIVYLIVQFLILLIFLIWWDGGGRITLFKRSFQEVSDEETDAHKVEADEELSHVASSNDGLRVLQISKRFGSVQAVDNVTFGIKKGEVFSLLGPNGAGKSTIISLVRGDLRPSTNRGDIFVEGYSLSEHRVAARNHLGVCPQFDAIDQMTVEGHLRFYARVRGVTDIEHNVTTVMRAVGLTPYRGRLAAKLSGGNKRKLSLAIALMGNPTVLLLDEPSSGMDAAAKRVMWRVLASITSGRALLITTHSMEEADALAQRAGIIAQRMLALGTTEELRQRHGNAYFVHLVHQDAPHTSTEEMDRLKAWIREHIADAVTEDRTYHGQLRFHVPISASIETTAQPKSAIGVTYHEKTGEQQMSIEPISSRRETAMSALFNLLESNKDHLGFKYYSVSPTTLDQVFLNVVNKHNIEEEDGVGHNTTRAGKGRRDYWWLCGFM